MFLLSVLMSFGMVGMMAPKASSSRATKSQAAAAKAKAKAKAKALANETSEKKRKQSNMVGQLKNASLKLQKVKQGDVKVSRFVEKIQHSCWFVMAMLKSEFY